MPYWAKDTVNLYLIVYSVKHRFQCIREDFLEEVTSEMIFEGLVEGIAVEEGIFSAIQRGRTSEVKMESSCVYPRNTCNSVLLVHKTQQKKNLTWFPW